MLLTLMRMVEERAVLTVARNGGGWAVECEGEIFGHSPDKEIARAAAHRKALQMQESGRACLVRVTGEGGFRGAL